MRIRDRIKELRRVRASALRPNPHNWRVHPQQQREALHGVLAEIGYADALLARPLPDGTLELIDGHLRAETTPDMEVPVLVVDLDDAEAAKLLAVHDPLAAMAQADEEMLAQLLTDVETDNEALGRLLDQMGGASGEEFDTPPGDEPDEPDVPELFQVVVECDGEEQQRELYERFAAEGLKCRLLNL
jgi:ParB-like chromosome segregation protein Spo0J